MKKLLIITIIIMTALLSTSVVVEATTVTKEYNILNAADDGNFYMGDNTVKTGGIFVGYCDEFLGYLNFKNVDIPKDSTIVSAYLQLRASDTDELLRSIDFITANTDSYTNPTNYSDLDIFDGGTCSSTWSVQLSSSYTVFTTNDISNIIQSVVNRDGWVSGNNVGILIDELDGDSGYEFSINSYGSISPPKLIVEYEGVEEEEDTTPPGEVSGITINTEYEEGFLFIQWELPNDSDFDYCKFYIDGIYSYDITMGINDALEVNDGTEHTYKITTVDTNGNESTGATINYTPIDTTPPGEVTNLRTGNDNYEYHDLMWDWSSDTDISHANVYKDGVFVKKVNHPVKWATFASDGNHTYTVKAVDLTGNESVGVEASYTAPDTTPPGEVISLNVYYGEASGVVWIDFIAPTDSDYNHINVYIDGVYYTNNNWTGGSIYTDIGREQTAVVKVTTVDNAGNESDGVEYTYVAVDTTPPGEVSNVSLSDGPPGELYINYTTPSDSDIDGCKIYKDGNLIDDASPLTANTYFYSSDMSFNSTVEVTYKIVTYDTTGNESAGFEITYTPPDITPPGEVTGLNITFGTGIRILNWTKTEDIDFSHVDIYVDDVFKSSESEQSSYSMTEDGLEHTYKIVSVDSTGNESQGAEITYTPQEAQINIFRFFYDAFYEEYSLFYNINLPNIGNLKDIKLYKDSELIYTKTLTATEKTNKKSSGYIDTTVVLNEEHEYKFTIVDIYGNESLGVTTTLNSNVPTETVSNAVLNVVDGKINVSFRTPSTNCIFYSVLDENDNGGGLPANTNTEYTDIYELDLDTPHTFTIYIDGDNGIQYVGGELNYTPPDTTPPQDIIQLNIDIYDAAIVNEDYRLGITGLTPNNADLNKIRAYRDGILIFEHVTGASEWFSYDIDENVIKGDIYNLKITTVDTSGNESVGIERVVSAEPPKDIENIRTEINEDGTLKITFKTPTDISFYGDSAIYIKGINTESYMMEVRNMSEITDGNAEANIEYTINTENTYITLEGNYSFIVKIIGGNKIQSDGVNIIFTPDVTPPSEVTSAWTSANTDNSGIKYGFTIPTDIDFNHVNMYVDGTLKDTYEESVIELTDTSLDVFENHTFKFTTVDNEDNESVGVEVIFSAVEVEIESITIDTVPNKVTYVEGQSFDKEGMTITAHYNDGSTSDVTSTVSINTEALIYGIDKVVVNYTEGSKTVTAEQPITVIQKVVESIKITNVPNKTAYVDGENFNNDGMEITATYNDNTEEVVTGYSITSNIVSLGMNYVLVVYEDKTVQQPITVVAREINSVEILTPPIKINYIEGQYFDSTGMKLIATYNDSSTEEITEYEVLNINKLNTVDMYVEVKYEGYIVNQTITVLAKEPVNININIDNLPNKLDYIEGQELDLTGGKITIEYNNGDTEEISIINEMITGFDKDTIGSQTLTVTFSGFTDTFEVNVLAKEIVSIEVTAPNKVSYIEGQDLDLTGGKVNTTFNNSTTEETDLTVDIITGFDNSVIGVQTLTVNHMGCTDTFEVDVIAKTPVSIEVIAPTKVNYIEGQNLDLNGGKVVTTYDNGTTSETDLTLGMVTGFDNSVVETQTLTVNHDGFTDTFDVDVIAKTPISIEVVEPTKTIYIEGQNLDLTNGKVNINYNNGSNDELELTIDMITGFDNDNIGAQILTVIHGEFTDTFEVNVESKQIISIEVKSPNKLEYIEGQELDLIGGVVIINYNNNTDETVDLEISMVTGYDSRKIGNQELTVEYGEFTNKFEVNVLSRSLTSIEIIEQPDKIVYIEEEDFDSTGMIIRANYDNGDTVNVDVEVINGNKLQLGNTEIELSYTEGSITVTTELQVTVIAKTLESIEINTPPNKTTYVEGEYFNSEGLTVIGHYSNGSVVSITNYTLVEDNLNYGQTEVIISYTEGNITKTVAQNITITKKQLENLSIGVMPDKVKYIEGQNFNSKGLIIYAHYNNGESKEVEVNVVEGNNLSIETNRVEVSYTEDEITKTVDINIEVVKRQLTSISLIEGYKTTYKIGEQLSIDNLRITLTYDNGTSGIENVSADMVSGFSSTSAGERKLTITKDGKQCSYIIKVVDEIKYISLVTESVKTDYYIGDKLNINGLKLDIVKLSGTTRMNVNADMITGFDTSSEGNRSLTVRYEEFTDTYSIEVIKNSIINIDVVNVKTEYLQNEEFYEAGKLVIKYRNGYEEYIKLSKSMIKQFSTSKPGQYLVVLEYNGYEAEYMITVNKVEEITPVSIEAFDNNQGRKVQFTTIKVIVEGIFKYIETPNGSKIYDKEFDYTVNSNGTYIFSVLGRDEKSGDSITVNIQSIDNTKPTIIFSIDDINDEVTIVNASDDSGIKKAYNPFGEEIELPYEFDASKMSGTFRVVDLAGNETSKDFYYKEIYVNEVSERTLITIEGVPKNWTNKDVVLKIRAQNYTDKILDIVVDEELVGQQRHIMLASNNMIMFAGLDDEGNSVLTKDVIVGSNKTYEFRVVTSKGQYQEDVVVTKIDKIKPIVNIVVEEEVVKIEVSDESSGIKSIVLPDGTVVEGNGEGSTEILNREFTVNGNGTFEVNVEDYAGNIVIKEFTVEQKNPYEEKIEVEEPVGEPGKGDNSDDGGDNSNDDKDSSDNKDNEKKNEIRIKNTVKLKDVIEGYIRGYENNKFNPDKYVTRAEVAQILSNIITNYGDVDVTQNDIYGSWYTEAVEKIISLGIMRGYEDNTFKPNSYITRQELAVTVYNMLDESYVIDIKKAELNDLYGTYGKESIKALVELGIIRGYEDNTFRPNNNITRAEAVSMINRLVKDYLTEERLNKFTDLNGHWAEDEINRAAIK